MHPLGHLGWGRVLHLSIPIMTGIMTRIAAFILLLHYKLETHRYSAKTARVLVKSSLEAGK
jgi:hypothetical protein